MTDPDAWMNDISTIVSRKNQAKQDAAKDKRDREQHAIEEYQKVRELVQGHDRGVRGVRELPERGGRDGETQAWRGRSDWALVGSIFRMQMASFWT